MDRVVLADDSVEFLAWLRATLDSADDFSPVGQAANGTEALALIARLAPDLAIIDIDMPGPDGIDVAQWVRQQALATRVILITGHADRAYARLAAEAGALAFIPKTELSTEALRLSLGQPESR